MSSFSFLRHRSGVLAGSVLCVAGWMAGWMISCAAVAMAAEATSREHEALFESRVRPLLAAKCQSCHGDMVAEAGLRLDSRRSLLAGSDSGPVLVPGDPQRPLRRIAWCTGGAQGHFEAAIAAGADAYITGEISEPQAHLARETGVAFLACGHHATERGGAPALAAHVAAQLGLTHQFIDIDNPA